MLVQCGGYGNVGPKLRYRLARSLFITIEISRQRLFDNEDCEASATAHTLFLFSFLLFSCTLEPISCGGDSWVILILAANTHFLNTQGVVHILQFVRVCLMLPAFFPPPREKYQPTTITLKLYYCANATHINFMKCWWQFIKKPLGLSRSNTRQVLTVSAFKYFFKCIYT